MISGDSPAHAIEPGGEAPSRWVAGLPMYDFPELADATDALWSAIAAHLAADGLEPPRSLSRNIGHRELWHHPTLLLAQACEYPLSRAMAASVRWVATPRYTAPGCEEGRYRSAIVVRTDDPAASLRDLRGRRCVINERDSNSGMNLLRAAIAPLAGGAAFFGSLSVSGSHRRSAEAVVAGTADVAAIDCVSYAHFQQIDPGIRHRLRRLDWTPASPSLPFITARDTVNETVTALRAALQAVLADYSLEWIRKRLLLAGVRCDAGGDGGEEYGEVLQHERRAIALGYPNLM